jgi:hypothetical protein
MPPSRDRDDIEDMTLVAERDDTRRAGAPRRFARDQTAGRDIRPAREDDGMDRTRRTEMQQLSQRIAHNAYDVDPHKVADAIVARLLAGSRADQRPDAQCS